MAVPVGLVSLLLLLMGPGAHGLTYQTGDLYCILGNSYDTKGNAFVSLDRGGVSINRGRPWCWGQREAVAYDGPSLHSQQATDRRLVINKPHRVDTGADSSLIDKSIADWLPSSKFHSIGGRIPNRLGVTGHSQSVTGR